MKRQFKLTYYVGHKSSNACIKLYPVTSKHTTYANALKAFDKAVKERKQDVNCVCRFGEIEKI